MALSLPLSTEKLIQLGEVLCQHFPEMNLDEITQQIERDATDFTTPIGQINYAISLSDFLEKVLKKHPHFLAQWWQTPPQFSDCQHYANRLTEQLAPIQNENSFTKRYEISEIKKWRN